MLINEASTHVYKWKLTEKTKTKTKKKIKDTSQRQFRTEATEANIKNTRSISQQRLRCSCIGPSFVNVQQTLTAKTQRNDTLIFCLGFRKTQSS